LNVLGRNCDVHAKNIALLINLRCEWRLAPAYDISHAWYPHGKCPQRHQMSLNGKRDGFERDDLIAFAGTAGIKRTRAERMLDRVIEALRRWPAFATEAGVDKIRVDEIQSAQVLDP
ncbi:MAG: HipA domain-containing protein, partial [bacterium]|nr:HipA domain-containing protein [bacterium]